MHRDYKTPEEVQAAITDLQKKYETTSLSKEQEKKTINDIKFLKTSLPFTVKYIEAKPQLDKLREKRSEIKDQQQKYKDEIQAMNAELDEVRKQQDESKAQQTDKNTQIKAYDDEIDNIFSDLQALYSKKDEVREEYYKSCYEYELERDQIKYAEWVQKTK